MKFFPLYLFVFLSCACFCGAMALRMVRPLEYYIITAGSTGHTHGITLYEEQEIFLRLGCTYARGLDGGGSAALIFEGRQINRPVEGEGNERAVIDFLSVTD